MIVLRYDERCTNNAKPKAITTIRADVSLIFRLYVGRSMA